MTRYLLTLLCVAVLGGCTTPVPQVIREPLPGSIAVAEARAHPQAHIGERVRWGGTIVKVENRQADTGVEVVSRPLSEGGRPLQTDHTGGRFIASFNEFLDPAVYTEGRRLTVVGTLVDTVTRSIGEHPYRFPLVKVDTAYLWEPLPKGPPYYDPFWYDPFWDPYWYYPWYPWHRPWRYPYYW